MAKLRTILLIDDDDTTNFVHKYLLEKSELADNIADAANGAEAIKFLSDPANDDVDLIFLDVNMPVMNGFEFLEKYESLPEPERKPCMILMLTSSVHPDDKRRAESFSSLSGYFEKPLTKDKVEKIKAEFFA